MTLASPRSVLVTGGAGFIGSSFVRSALHRHPDASVVTLDVLSHGGDPAHLDGLGPRHRLVVGNILDGRLVARLMSEHHVDLVVHLAAESHVDRSIEEPAAFVRTNVLGTQVMLDAAREAWEGRDPREVRFHHVSTDEVYGDLGPEDPPFTERTPYAPSSPYSASKAGADHLVRAAARTHGLPVSLTHCSNNYGPRQHAEKLIPTVLHRALAGRPIPVYGDGSNVRDWLHVSDHCDALWTVIERGELGETYNVGGNAEVGNLALVQTLCGLLDARRPEHAPHAELIEFVRDRPGHDRRYAVDTTKIEGLGWRPGHDFASGLADTVDWYLDPSRRSATRGGSA